ncbi:MAG: hypothetical protein K2M81_08090, partial [Lachnospiraceae bacterium]|nr:hypothetical protein [Lachnospiraceae bacterium]
MSKEAKSFLAGGIAFVLFAMLRSIIPLHNMEFFVAACAIFVCVAVLAYFIMDRRQGSIKPAIEKIWSVFAIVLLTVWIVLFYINETNTEHSLQQSELIRRYFPFPLWIILMFIGVAVSLFFLRAEPK